MCVGGEGQGGRLLRLLCGDIHRWAGMPATVCLGSVMVGTWGGRSCQAAWFQTALPGGSPRDAGMAVVHHVMLAWPWFTT